MYDTIIIGAGVSGAYAAYLLSKRGFKTLLIEKYKLPREKLCAGGVSVKARRLLDIDITPVIHKEIDTIRFGFCGEQETFYRSEYPIIFTVDRKEFDFLLLQQAKGIDIIDGKTVRDIIVKEKQNIVKLDNGDVYAARYVIIATGALDNLAQKVAGIKIKKYRGFGVEFLAYSSEVKNEIYIDFGIPPDGYSWVFPRKEGYIVGCGNVYGSGREMKSALMEFVEIKKEYNTGHTSNLRGHPIDSVGDKKPTLASQNVFVLGEAGGLVDTLTGEGIYYSLFSAKILSEILPMDLSDVEKVKLYNKRIIAEIWPEIKYSHKLANFINKKRVFAYSLIYKSSNLKKMFFKIFTGEVKYSEAMRGNFILKRFFRLWKERLNLYVKKKTP